MKPRSCPSATCLEKYELSEQIFETVKVHLRTAVSAWGDRSWRSLRAIVDDVSDVMGWAAYLSLSVIIALSAMTAMPQFALLFADCAGFGVEMVTVMDPDNAQDIAS